MKKIALLLMIPFAALSLPKSSIQSDDDGESCVQCHTNLMSGTYKHEAATDGCYICHESNGQPHPQPGVKGFTLGAEVPELCMSCHDGKNQMSNVHDPVSIGKCTACHSPHSSVIPKLINQTSMSALCSQCHDQPLSGLASSHQPVKEGMCSKCHEPHQSESKSLLRPELTLICAGCHENQKQQLGMSDVHPPFEMNCGICHAGHESGQSHLLKDPISDLCFGCHDDILWDMEEQPFTHKPLKEETSCIQCHSPHASAQGKLLVKEEMELCFGCHNRTYKEGDRIIINIKQQLQKSKTIHPPIESSGCSACHAPHTAKFPNLLTHLFPTTNYVPAVKDSFALCFSCHNPELMELPKTTTATGFRNGDKNLHYTHINGDKGRSCTLCHDVHGSPNQHLIREKVPFSTWEMDMEYKLIEGGGACYPGCHSEKTYIR